MSELGYDARRIDRAARDLALRSDEDVSLREVLGLVSDLAAVVALLADRAMYGYTGTGVTVTVRP